MSVIRQGGLVFDIGAHKGESAASFLCAGAGRVVCVEAGAEFCEEIRRYIPSVIVLNAACVDKHGPDVKWFRADDDDGRSTIDIERWGKVYGDEKFSEPQTVGTITLDTLKLAFGQPDYIKIDVEGGEYPVLLGMNYRSEYLTFEFHGCEGEATRQCVRRLIELGYTKYIGMISDVNIELLPTQPLTELLSAPLPVWGNITVGR